MKVLYIISFALLILVIEPQNVCYVSCSKGSCLASNALACTACDPGTQLINQRCSSIGSLSQPYRLIVPTSQNILDITGFPSFQGQNQIQCRTSNNAQSGVIKYLNVTISLSQIYSIRLNPIIFRSPHQFVQIKFNAILFNSRANTPQIRVLIIDQEDRRIFDNKILPNEPNINCTGIQGALNNNRAFYVKIGMPSQSKSYLFSLITVNVGDQLGLTDFNAFYGNCFAGCASCQGPGQRQCLSCINMLSFNRQTKECSRCPSRFYQLNKQCLACPYNCLQCVFSVQLGRPVCSICEASIISSNATVPTCQVNNYINQSLWQLRFNNSDGWKSSTVLTNITSLCGAYSLVGGFNGFGGSTVQKVFTNLPVHRKIWLKFLMVLIDQIPGMIYRYQVRVDGIPVGNRVNQVVIDSGIMNTNQCGSENQQFFVTVLIIDIDHVKQNATVQVRGQMNYFGIRDFTLGVLNLTDLQNCDQVNSQNRCIRCKNGFAFNASQNSNRRCSQCPAGYYQKDQYCQVCPIYCKSCTSTDLRTVRCGSCDFPLVFDQRAGTCNDQNGNLYTVALSQKWQDNMTDHRWFFYPKLQNRGIDSCGPYSILGSKDIIYRRLKMTRTFDNLPNHQGVHIHFFFYQIDDFDGALNGNSQNSVQFILNGRKIPYNVSRSGYNMCGNESYDSIQKITLTDPNHNTNTLTMQIVGQRTKFGISNFLLFLSNCQQCSNYGISYYLEVVPMYSAESAPDPTQRGLKSKIVFDDKIYTSENLKQLFQVRLVDRNIINNQTVQMSLLSQGLMNNTNNPNNPNNRSNATRNPGSFGRGQRQPYAILSAQLYANRQLNLYQNIVRDQIGSDAIATLLAPDSVYGYKNGLLQSLKLRPVTAPFSRYDDIYSVVDNQNLNGAKYRANTRNLMNLFRGISILALFIGLISFFFGLSDVFDDLFLLCQIIFVHIFIQSPWISATMKIPVGAMNLVQFMAWLPYEGRLGVENGIIPSNHYQRSPLVYQQYWKDITFARTIYHTVIFLAAMLAFYWLIRLVKSIRQPKIGQIFSSEQKNYRYTQLRLYEHVKRWFVFLDRVIRFTFFTVMWASCLQFIDFINIQPASFRAWNQALCIVMFVAYVVYIFLGYCYLRSQSNTNTEKTYKQKFDGIRIRSQRLWYFVLRYLKYLAIAFLIGQLYNANPLAVLIPLLFIHLADAIIIGIFKPFILDSQQSNMIVSRCSKFYWKYYWISHIVQNALFFVLEIILIIMYGVRNKANKTNYLSIGYACCAFIIMLLVNGLIRLIWGFIRQFQVCVEDRRSKEQQIKSQKQIGPLKFLDILRANQNQDGMYTEAPIARPRDKRPSIDNIVGLNQ